MCLSILGEEYVRKFRGTWKIAGTWVYPKTGCIREDNKKWSQEHTQDPNIWGRIYKNTESLCCTPETN